MELMKLEIVTPTGVIFDAEVKQVTLPGSEGEFGVLPKHATLVSLLDTGVIVINKADGSELAVAINSGYVKVDEEKTTCIVDGAVSLSGEDGDIAAALEEAKKLIKSTEASSSAIAAAVSKVEQIGKSY
ncbi:MAG TPA: ATP synthase F1 subunit epsilon [Sulfurovum sp.]|jgi:F-type H+-transporting ATPase subunit epsilon|nr:MAG: F0F1 ATP synthase subunit epsilon [Sulfurovum sp. 35-42-20]OYZ26063.1 MAG: F0F1 ATP synthase subunit epsilon [Sulfurovum sp. 16-42-52]OYZ50454.1 MAG: F0F1 ATP synthase subunit epsilon [Sulfurovum sp. 24-42-9]OZA46002.1 MAG: F0F1 ATP synthase subunit epsilon [Sulfurovum sp. 17-42-90]OZA61444.1 MAG: F0F1 ATP synthase subunit epsilon [Sulfurovum sp. 39-42-12]HQR74555.1 ATP synthase F1 subunit epsilon [Sulfurovum sp.]